ncbi:MAG TPA: hypothetical protein ENJ29_04830 [Bacteroidetes bacterium]|nr:hypothetical protein [Bacteroidota bacterium]
MASTISMEIFEKHAENVYEAIIMIARRARQINSDYKIMIEREFGYMDMNEDFEDEETEQHDIVELLSSLPKPPSKALEEFMNGELVVEYADENVN